ncbi:MAG: WD40 repeat domain-containing protein [Verrucomicrobiota bacterium]|nr:WD40 repeat domain-containing protein [Verrucomicrobiota bacterium]
MTLPFPSSLIRFLKCIALASGLLAALPHAYGVLKGPDGVVWQKVRHGDTITAQARSADGSLLVVASDDDTVKVFTDGGQTLLRTINMHPWRATALAISPDGMTLAVGNYRGRVRQVELATGVDKSNMLLFDSKIMGLSYTPDGKTLAVVADQGSMALYKTSPFASSGTLSGHSAHIAAQAMSPDGKYLATVDWTGTAIVWQISTKAKVKTLADTTAALQSVLFTTDGSTLVTAGDDGQLRLYRTTDWALTKTMATVGAPVTSLAMTTDGAYLTAGTSTGSVFTFEPPYTADPKSISVGTEAITTLVPDTSGDGIMAACGTARGIVNPAANAVSQTGNSRRPQVIVSAISSDNFMVAEASGVEITLLSIVSGAVTNTFTVEKGFVACIALSPDGKYLAAGTSGDGSSVVVWNVSTGEKLYDFDDVTDSISAVAFTPDSAYLAAAGANDAAGIRLWALADGSLWKTLTGNAAGYAAIAFAGNNLFALGRYDAASITGWNLATGLSVVNKAIPGARLMSLMEGSNQAAVVVDAAQIDLQILSLASLATVTSIPLENVPSAINATSNGRTIILADGNGVRWMDVATKTVAYSTSSGIGAASNTALSPNGNLALLTGRDSSLILQHNPLSPMAGMLSGLQASPTNPNNYSTAWFGTFYGGAFPWALHDVHGWLYLADAGGGTSWAWAQESELQWLWLAAQVYPWLYSSAQTDWVYYFPGSKSPRYFYVPADEKWLTLE